MAAASSPDSFTQISACHNFVERSTGSVHIRDIKIYVIMAIRNFFHLSPFSLALKTNKYTFFIMLWNRCYATSKCMKDVFKKIYYGICCVSIQIIIFYVFNMLLN
jgi:hypothetical protein